MLWHRLHFKKAFPEDHDLAQIGYQILSVAGLAFLFEKAQKKPGPKFIKN